MGTITEAVRGVDPDYGYPVITLLYEGVPILIHGAVQQKFLNYDTVFVGNKAFVATIIYDYGGGQVERLVLPEHVTDTRLADLTRAFFDDESKIRQGPINLSLFGGG